ncbi:MAG: exo-beta-N-acetylmuramidase NamZ domain-containing protein [Chitinophagaceae bacterium]
MAVNYGIDVLLTTLDINWKNKRIALATNNAALTKKGVPVRKALQNANFNLVKLFSPEHGITAMGADGKPMLDGIDDLTNLPIVSLYNNKLYPLQKDLFDVEIIVFDIPDCGARFYTFLWTMTYLLEVCSVHKIPFVILDRPNPLSGDLLKTEGPILQESCASFLGRFSIPITHGCTMAELAVYFDTIFKWQVDISIYRCTNWQRNQYLTDTNLIFVPTSPAITSYNSMLLYPGLCFLEATNLSEGRFTNHSFEVVAAPWLNAKELMKILTKEFSDCLLCSETVVTPTKGKYQGIACNAVVFTVINKQLFKPVWLGIYLLKAVIQLHANTFKWDNYPTMVNPTGANHLDKLIGITNATTLIYEEHYFWKNCLNTKHWQHIIQPYLLYT